MRFKSPGISILVALSVSLLMSTMAMGLMLSLHRSFDRSVTVENTLRFYYGIESGLEAGLFHRQSRSTFAHMEPHEAQVVSLYDGALQNDWSVESKRDTLWGLLQPHSSLQIDFEEPTNQVIENAPSSPLAPFGDGQSFSLTLYRSSEEMPEVQRSLFEKQFGPMDFRDFVFYKERTDEPLVDWYLQRLHQGKGLQVFRPSGAASGHVCQTTLRPSDITFRLCASHIENAQLPLSLSSLDEKVGVVQTLETGAQEYDVSFRDFIDFGNPETTQYRLILNPVSPFLKDPDYPALPPRIPGIPFVVHNAQTVSAQSFPLPEATVASHITFGEAFQRETSVRIPHQKGNPSFNYIIFE